MRVTSIRSLPDSDEDDALSRLDETVKSRLTRNHVVRNVSTVKNYLFADNTAFHRISNYRICIAPFQVVPKRVRRLIMLSKRV